VNVTNITNVYNRTVIVNNHTHVAFNGGRGGVAARPTAQQQAWARESHRGPIAAQMQHQQAASQNRALFARENHGRPPVAATARPGDFRGHGVVAAKATGGTYHAPAMSPRQARVSAPVGNRSSENRASQNQAANRPSGNRSSSRGSNSNYRPANSPNRSNTSDRPPSANRSMNNSPTSNNRTSSNRPLDNRSAKPFSLPPSSRASNPPRQNSAPRSQNTHPSSAQAARPSHESHAQSAPRPTYQPRQSAPRPTPQARQSAPRPAPQPREGAAKSSPSSPRAQNAPPRRPPDERKQR
jgi:hypothetical protein